MRDMDIAAEIIGIRPLHAKLSAFAVSSFYIGVAGALWAFLRLGSWEPLAFDINRSFQILFMVIIGGLGSILGSFLGAAFIVLMPIFLNQVPGMARHPAVDCDDFAPGIHDFRRHDRVFPDRGAAWPGPAMGDRQGKAAAMAVPLLTAILRGGPFAGTMSVKERVADPSGQTNGRFAMRKTTVGLAVGAVLGVTAVAAPAMAQNEQFIPALVYRTGAYAPNGVPFANGIADYYKLVNERDGGINGVKIVIRGMRIRLRHRPRRRVLRAPEEARARPARPTSSRCRPASPSRSPRRPPIDKIPIISMGYGRSESRDGSVFQWNFPLLGTYWTAADIIIQHIAKKEGGFDKLKGKKIALVYHDSPYGKEPIALLDRARQACTASRPCSCRSPIRASSRRRPGCRSARTGPTTCCCGAGA